jgi:hypothetical protein
VGYTAPSSNKPWDINQQTKCQVIQLAVTNSPGGQSKKTGFNGINPQKQMSNNHNKRVFSNNVLLVASSSSQIV